MPHNTTIHITYTNVKHGYVRLLPDGSLKLTIPLRKKNDDNFKQQLLKLADKLIQKVQKKDLNKITPISSEGVIIFGNLEKIDGTNPKLKSFLKQKLFETAQPLINFYTTELGVKYKQLNIKDIKSKRGSCSSSKNITLNLKLVHLPLKYTKYVCIHEVCHLLQMNHSPKFWKLVEHFEPDYKIIRKDLKNIVF